MYVNQLVERTCDSVTVKRACTVRCACVAVVKSVWAERVRMLNCQAREGGCSSDSHFVKNAINRGVQLAKSGWRVVQSLHERRRWTRLLIKNKRNIILNKIS